MRRYLTSGLAVLVLAVALLFWWRSASQAEDVAVSPPLPAVSSPAASTDHPPQATEKTREEKRFARYDKDKNGRIAPDEYFLARRKAFAKMDVNGDGRLVFEEYAAKTVAKFATADTDRSGVLTTVEFATTRVVRKHSAAPNRACPQPGKGEDE